MRQLVIKCRKVALKETDAKFFKARERKVQMSAVVKKLKSNSGATLMLALLFFVVCAVTGSMILVSATAAAGRLDGLGRKEQNYYAVRSATKLVEKQLKSEFIEVKEILTVIKETETEVDEDGIEHEVTTTSYDYSGPKFYSVTVNASGEEGAPVEISDGTGMILSLLKDENVSNYMRKKGAAPSSDPDHNSAVTSYPSEFNLNWFKEGSGESAGKLSGITVSSDGSDISSLSVDLTAKMDSTGLLTVTVSNPKPDSGESDPENIGSGSADVENRYSMVLKMQCSKSRELKDGDSGTVTEGGVTTETTQKIRIYKFKFETESIEKQVKTTSV